MDLNALTAWRRSRSKARSTGVRPYREGRWNMAPPISWRGRAMPGSGVKSLLF